MAGDEQMQVQGPSSLENLKRIRSVIKGQITRVEKWAAIAQQSDDNALEVLEEKLRDLKKYRGEFNSTQQQIEILTLGDPDNEQQWFKVEDQFYRTLTILTHMVKVNTPPPIPSSFHNVSEVSAGDAANASAGTHPVYNSNHLDVKLPTFHLPTFDGKIEDYFSFRELFKSLIESCHQLNKITMFHYLRNSLKGSAANVIKNLPAIGENYERAWQLLDSRYHCRGTIIEKLSCDLLNLNALHYESATSLRKLTDDFIAVVSALEALNADRDSLLVSILFQKLDYKTKKQIKIRFPAKTDTPQLDSVLNFLDERISALQVSAPNKVSRDQETRPVRVYNAMTTDKYSLNKQYCPQCRKTNHNLTECETFFKLSVPQRTEVSNTNRDQSSIPVDEEPSDEPVTLANHLSACRTSILLSTAIVYVYDRYGSRHSCRCLLDNGSQVSFITSEFANLLQLSILPSSLVIQGIAGTKGTTSKKIMATIESRHSTYNKVVEFFVLPRITQHIPTARIDCGEWNIPQHIKLADETFDCPGEINALLGAELFYDLLHRGRYASTAVRPALQNTRLGWVISGPVPSQLEINMALVNLTLHEKVEQFWTIEHSPIISNLTHEKEMCEQHFQETHTRLSSGRYCVQLPFKKESSLLGKSRYLARRRWLAVESRLSCNIKLHESYTEFMREYISLGHMTCLGKEETVLESLNQYYIPHHCVFKTHTSSTKVRVVFDASAKTTSGYSLNNLLMNGPVIQSDLFSILLRFRLSTYVMTADVSKMYRQVLIDIKDRSYHYIFWRESINEPLKIYQLNTVTYGTTPAPFLATRTLQQLFKDEKLKYPLASEMAGNWYVDDLICGHDDLQVLQNIQNQLISMLKTGGFQLRKWATNERSLLNLIPEEDCESLEVLQLLDGSALKTLGLIWAPKSDTLHYHIESLHYSEVKTKRQLLSQIASLFDPLGLLGPVIIMAKIFMQELWSLKTTWDETLPLSFTSRWDNYSHSLSDLSSLNIHRHVSLPSLNKIMQLHRFADASIAAYGCCIYLRVQDTVTKEITVHLVCAKSRVAPQKTVSLPRLELCAALLLSKLIYKVSVALNINHDIIFTWTDSSIALAWIRAPPYHWQTFVANRVAEIQEHPSKWNHIPSAQNPADLLSRGCTVTKLRDSQLWWRGPELLYQNDDSWPLSPETSDIEVPERRIPKYISLHVELPTSEGFAGCSKYWTLIRAVARILRYHYNALHKSTKMGGPLTTLELNKATTSIIKIVQAESFSQDIANLNSGSVSVKSRLLSLDPFIDDSGVLRVGGRLQHSNYTYDKKCPAILPGNHWFTTLIINYEHLRGLHSGASLTLAMIRNKFWIVNGRNVVRRILYRCVKCFHTKPRNHPVLMGQLPANRVELIRPFLHTGLDYAGTFYIKPPTRSKIRLKVYVAIFLCMATKAVHIELVGALTTVSFIATLKRFISRRGHVSSIACDNATTFKGAANELTELYSLLRQGKDDIHQFLAQRNIHWEFIPPRTPHFGGLWEAGVKSVKYHLKRIAGMATLTYEEFYTLLVVIESCLNSRPLTPMSSDPNDLEVLTPGHFLIGAPLLAMVEHDCADVNINRLTRWQRVTAMSQHFWKRWYNEYLTTLNPRVKWSNNGRNLTVGQLVIIHEDNVPPLQWRLGRISKVFPGIDGIVRTASIRTAGGEIKRGVK